MSSKTTPTDREEHRPDSAQGRRRIPFPSMARRGSRPAYDRCRVTPGTSSEPSTVATSRCSVNTSSSGSRLTTAQTGLHRGAADPLERAISG